MLRGSERARRVREPISSHKHAGFVLSGVSLVGRVRVESAYARRVRKQATGLCDRLSTAFGCVCLPETHAAHASEKHPQPIK